MTTSGTAVFNPTYADLMLTAFDRIQVRGSAITGDHVQSFRLETNIMLKEWGAKGVNLWAVDNTISIPLSQGQTTFNLPADTVQLLDCYRRTYPMSPPVNLAPAFTATNLSAVVTVAWPAHGLTVGAWFQVVIPVAIGGLILLGFYQVASVLGSDSFTFNAASAATSGAGPGGAVPQFATTAGSATATVNLTNHGLLAGATFNVQVATNCGGLVLSGAYVIQTATANSFTITAASPAGFNDTESENGGQVQVVGQNIAADPQDIILSPLSRTDYAAQPDKFQQSVPTSYWFNRQAPIPQVSIWPTADANGPYVFQAFRMRKLQDANILATETADIPDRFFEAYVADAAHRMARAWRPQLEDKRLADKERAWNLAAPDDSERVATYLRPDMSAYFR